MPAQAIENVQPELESLLTRFNNEIDTTGNLSKQIWDRLNKVRDFSTPEKKEDDPSKGKESVTILDSFERQLQLTQRLLLLCLGRLFV